MSEESRGRGRVTRSERERCSSESEAVSAAEAVKETREGKENQRVRERVSESE